MRSGQDATLSRDPATGLRRHTMFNVYSEMLLQIARDYRSLPDLRTLRLREIRFFYEGLRGELKRATTL